MKIDWKGNFLLAIPVTIAIWLVSFLFSVLKIGTIANLYSSIPATAVITPTAGTSILNMIMGLVPFSFSIPAIFYMYVSAWATLLVGSFLLSFGLPSIKGAKGNLMSVIWYGAAAFYLLFVGLIMPGGGTTLWIGIAVWTFLVVMLSGWISSIIKVKF